MIRLLLPLCLIFITLIVGCDSSDDDCSNVDENGLTKGITDLVPQYILDEMDSLGMPIYGGADPPIIEGAYIAQPFILLDSNRPGDVIGGLFSDYLVTFYSQDNDNLEVMVDYVNDSEVGNGLGSFIVGEDCNFSVFVEINTQITSGDKAKSTNVLSGCLTDIGIEDLHVAVFMIDNYGNPSGYFIENGEGRIIYDQDKISERQ